MTSIRTPIVSVTPVALTSANSCHSPPVKTVKAAKKPRPEYLAALVRDAEDSDDQIIVNPTFTRDYPLISGIRPGGDRFAHRSFRNIPRRTPSRRILYSSSKPLSLPSATKMKPGAQAEGREGLVVTPRSRRPLQTSLPEEEFLHMIEEKQNRLQQEMWGPKNINMGEWSGKWRRLGYVIYDEAEFADDECEPGPDKGRDSQGEAGFDDENGESVIEAFKGGPSLPLDEVCDRQVLTFIEPHSPDSSPPHRPRPRENSFFLGESDSDSDAWHGFKGRGRMRQYRAAKEEEQDPADKQPQEGPASQRASPEVHDSDSEGESDEVDGTDENTDSEQSEMEFWFARYEELAGTDSKKENEEEEKSVSRFTPASYSFRVGSASVRLTNWNRPSESRSEGQRQWRRALRSKTHAIAKHQISSHHHFSVEGQKWPSLTGPPYPRRRRRPIARLRRKKSFLLDDTDDPDAWRGFKGRRRGGQISAEEKKEKEEKPVFGGTGRTIYSFKFETSNANADLPTTNNRQNSEEKQAEDNPEKHEHIVDQANRFSFNFSILSRSPGESRSTNQHLNSGSTEHGAEPTEDEESVLPASTGDVIGDLQNKAGDNEQELGEHDDNSSASCIYDPRQQWRAGRGKSRILPDVNSSVQFAVENPRMHSLASGNDEEDGDNFHDQPGIPPRRPLSRINLRSLSRINSEVRLLNWVSDLSTQNFSNSPEDEFGDSPLFGPVSRHSADTGPLDSYDYDISDCPSRSPSATSESEDIHWRLFLYSSDDESK
ncbi:hypothetical protein J3R30DRAFT_3694562 [Lentinula aciculospora]|uniref:Uncharacterized protein n=1 Tax=Lentinula aciculospora TaxID=153920 RepID=A0A9W9AUD8_9AGAR|nr:hypothetical protein J3R30DRAFT_3694562 [Lentinula aciculospora]